MLAIYNGKEYVCRDNSRLRNDGTRTKCWLELRSHTKDEDLRNIIMNLFRFYIGVQKKCVYVRILLAITVRSLLM